ncbi:DUF6600 domain-containing protein [Dyella flava]|uniref:FecR family protein n=1 Tax=Dyella flava TaxID=1920170 RepID=A0ABS2K711_9GAMM|nr:DUF6600 domain-containing protein [Dyella flava]MBM7126971.1 hypothetical protein [Dyella flava]GLQ50268.1 hypothetical protein GCM10010872_17170 [Dyella flava]
MRVFNASLSRTWQIGLSLLLLICTGMTYAQSDAGQDSNANDPPPRVARLAIANGDLGLLPAGSTEWTSADVNRPLTNGDKLSSGPDSRAELDLGGAALRIDGQSDIGILNLNGQTGQFELPRGSLNITVRNIDQGATYEIDTPTLAVVIDQPGSFRVDVPGDGNSTTVAVSDGLATVYGENNAQREIYSGRRYQFNNSTLSDVTVSDFVSGDAFDLWCNDRDTQEANDSSAQYVSNDMVGGDDLDNAGSWEEDEDYGDIWYPAVVGFGWAPYRFGHWAWIWPWGWTWIDNAPWGFAPYHYGRWAFIHQRWGWIPGPRQVRPIYAPALVAFVGMGAGHPVGWFPLGPRDVYSPWYHASRNYYTNVNLANIGVGRYNDQTALIDTIHNQYGLYQIGRAAPGNAYAYRNAPEALSAVSAQNFASARNVQNNLVQVNAQQLAAASMVAPTALQRPTTSSFGQPRLIDGRSLPSAGFNRQVVAVGRPAAAVSATASVSAGQPASNVRVLSVRPSTPVSSHAQVVGSAEIVRQPRFTPPQSAPQRVEQEAAESSPATLPQVPHFESAQQVPRYQPVTQSYAPREENPEQDRFETAERSHQYVPEQRPPEINPSYQPYQRPDFARPEQQGRGGEEMHPQSAPRGRESAPAPSRGEGHP